MSVRRERHCRSPTSAHVSTDYRIALYLRVRGAIAEVAWIRKLLARIFHRAAWAARWLVTVSDAKAVRTRWMASIRVVVQGQ
jgi:hypothetical protein